MQAPANFTLQQYPEKTVRHLRDYEWSGAIPMALVHLSVLGAFWTGVTVESVVCCVALYSLRMWGVTAGYHRYFSHRSFKTSRLFQFVLAFVAQGSAQRGALWWAAHHRVHHKKSDQPGDAHSPVVDGFWYSHIGWLFYKNSDTEWSQIKDFAKYPELVWLNKYFLVPPVLMAVTTLWLFDLPGLLIGFMLSTVFTWHSTFAINSLTHVFGYRRYETGDDSRNHWLLALVTLGEGWHNNHHYYQSAARCGFHWWEVDITWYGLKALSWLGIVWDLREIPDHVRDDSSKKISQMVAQAN